MKIIKNVGKATGASLMSLGLLVGLSGFAGAATTSIERTGPHSENKVEKRTTNRTTVRNNNDLRLNNNNYQDAWTGDAKAYHNTTAGSVRTGDARNSNSLDVNATVNNTGSSAAAARAASTGGGTENVHIENTGPRSENKVEITARNTTRVVNNNDIKIDNVNEQYAESGDATVAGNTTGGSATTGNATNTNSTSIRLNVSN